MQKEAVNISAFIQLLRKAEHPLDGIAILYPRHAYGDLVEEQLLRDQIPLQRYGKNTIAERYARFRDACGC